MTLPDPLHYPIGVSLATAVRWYTRVRAWKLTASWPSGTVTYSAAPYTPPPGDPSFYTTVGNWSATAEFNLSSSALSYPVVAETDLATYSPAEVFSPSTGYAATYGTLDWNYDPFGTGDGPTAVGSMTFEMFLKCINEVPGSQPVPMYYDPASKLFYPRMQVAFSMFAGGGADTPAAGHAAFGGSQGIGIESFDEPPGDPIRKPATLTVTCDGYTWTQPATVLGAGRPDDIEDADFSDDTSTEATLTIEPSLFWESRGVDNIVCWDHLTGDPAINPATGSPFTLDEIAAMPCP